MALLQIEEFPSQRHNTFHRALDSLSWCNVHFRKFYNNSLFIKLHTVGLIFLCLICHRNRILIDINLDYLEKKKVHLPQFQNHCFSTILPTLTTDTRVSLFNNFESRTLTCNAVFSHYSHTPDLSTSFIAAFKYSPKNWEAYKLNIRS